MRTIAFVTQKGGAGKSTLASNIGVAASKTGERVFVVDLDPLQSLTHWSKARASLDVPVEHIPPHKLPEALIELENKGVSLVIIDAPGSDCEFSHQAIDSADLCVIPARPNAFDLWASEFALARVKASRRDFVFLLNQCPPAQQSARIEQGVKALQDMGALITPLISTRVDYQQAVRLGLGVCEYNPNGAAAKEIRELWTSLRSRLEAGGPARFRPNAEHETAGARASLASSSYGDLFAEAVKVGTLYSDFMTSLFRARQIETAPKPAAPSSETSSSLPSKD
jgi:chromosome partitioning protein